MTALEQYIGDSKTYQLPLTWEGSTYTLEAEEVAIFSAKYRVTDEDAAVVFQKALGAGMAITDSTATLDVLRPDTLDEPYAVTLVCDIQATRTDGSTRTIWEGTLKLKRDVSRLTQTSVPVVTTEPPLPVGPAGPQGPAGADGSDGQGVPLGGTTGQILRKTSATDFDTEWATAAGSGDMLAATYDPTSVSGDAFDMANMAEAADAKVMTAAERAKLANQSGTNTGDQDLSPYETTTQLNARDTANRARANHTGTQTLATISDAGGAAALDVGTTPGTVAAGDDSRLSDARTPTAHTHPASDVTDFDASVAASAAVAANTAKTSNATHTGDVTGSTALTIAPGAVTETKCNASINASLDLADSAVQPGDDAADLGSGAATDGHILTADGAGGAAWEAAPSGGTVDVVSNVAQDRIIGRVTAGAGDSEELTAAQVRTLINVEDGASADQTGAEIKAAYEAEADTNAFTDAEKSLLANQSGTNTGDQDLSGLQPKPAEGQFADGDKTKLDGIEAAADVTDSANVGSTIHGATAKTTPVDADTLPMIDSADSNALKKLTFANLWAWVLGKIGTLLGPQTVSSSSGTLTVNFGTQRNAATTLTEDVTTLTVSGLPSGQTAVLAIKQDATAAWTFDPSSTVTILDGDAADVATVTATTGIILLTIYNDGTTNYGAFSSPT